MMSRRQHDAGMDTFSWSILESLGELCLMIFQVRSNLRFRPVRYEYGMKNGYRSENRSNDFITYPLPVSNPNLYESGPPKPCNWNSTLSPPASSKVKSPPNCSLSWDWNIAYGTRFETCIIFNCKRTLLLVIPRGNKRTAVHARLSFSLFRE